MNTKILARNYPLLIDLLVDRSSLTAKAMLVLIGSLVLTLSAKTMLPIGPIPITLQTFAVLMLGVVMGPRLGLLAVSAYIAQGVCGLPVFYDMLAGPVKFFGPTGGYLIGMFPAVWIAGCAAERGKDRSFWTALPYLAVAHQTIFLFGVAWLAVLSGDWMQGFLLGYMPFFGVDILKFVAASALAAGLWKFNRTV